MRISSKGLPDTATTTTFKAVRKQYFALYYKDERNEEEERRLKVLDSWSKELFRKARASK